MISRQTLLLNLVLCLTILQVKGQKWAKDNCSDTCGDIKIPYPFGMNSNSCYLNQWFEITCNRSSINPSKFLPFLSKFKLEVLNISLYSPYSHYEQTITVNHPIVSTCRDQSLEINLTGSPFAYSSYDNRFMAAGCDSEGILTNQTGEILTGCYSRCPKSSVSEDKNCFGIYCCHTTVPDELTMYKVNISSYGVESNDGNCSYAFLVSEQWWTDARRSASTYDIVTKTEYIPVILFWWLKSHTSPDRKNECHDDVAGYEYADYSPGFDYGNYDYNYICACPSRYEGNPYIAGGCKGYDECSNRTCNGHCKIEPGWGYVCHPRNVKEIIIGVSTSFGSMFLLLGSFALYKIMVKRRNRRLKQKFFKRNGGLLLQQQVSTQDGKVEKTKIFTSEELKTATDNFHANRVLGHGGQGTVYKGMLTDGKIVAVKKSIIMDESQVEQFINEIVILSQINHRNVVQLFGCCLETEVPLLVYEFVPNGTLFEHIHNEADDFPMLWETRLRIIAEIANSLAYLHSSTSVPVYHRDIKSTNILLDDKHRAKVSDFGTSKSIPMEQTHLTTLVQGTFGYLDPEYFQTSQFTDKSDVYSFGVVMVELLTSQKPITWTKSQEERSLATIFLIAMEENRLFDILDPKLLKEKKSEMQIVVVAKLAQLCLNLNGKKRPTMKSIAMELERIQASAMSTFTYETVQLEDMHGIVENIGSLDATTSSAPSTTVFSDNSLPLSFDIEPFLIHIT